MMQHIVQNNHHQQSPYLKAWQAKQDEIQASTISNYNPVIKFVKLCLPLAAMLILTVFLVYPMVTKKFASTTNIGNDTNTTQAKAPVMKNPRFRGVDNKNQEYNVTSIKATQLTENLVELQDITADFLTNDKDWMSLVAAKGQIDIDKQTLLLTDAADFFISTNNDKIYEISSQQVLIDLNKSTLQCLTTVKAYADIGSIKANKCFVDKNTNRAKFTGNVKIVLDKGTP